ncbi:NAD(P)-binding protein [Sistotremastrum suecicum HHB10207 ss-3]|uniref:NAD(P)-binding protein n=1 Tax=Sistotremastrum suecicum HHB10207 ss-3 TaxID=1314776 RepID=A0A165YBR4_9AGAM|nr:NAD(P)-binding protein [Sistotremastrum suecicum HHB10207 ss-3]
MSSQIPKKVVIVGGHGHVALRLARLLTPTHVVHSIHRSPEHTDEIAATRAVPYVLSLEDSPVEAFSVAFEDSDVVVFSAGAGGKGGAERTKKVDYEGALKVFEAIEGVKGKKPRLILVSAVDSRNPDIVPDHYNEEDKARSAKYRESIPAYVKWKYEADKNLVARTSFEWTILRPGGLTHEPGVGKADIGKTHITESISRDDVAATLALLVDRPDAGGLALDLVGGETPIAEALDAAIKDRVTAWIG